MIDEEATFENFGYYSYDLKPHSQKKIIAVCDGCGKVRIATKNTYHALCKSCSQKGERNALFGRKGVNHPQWKGGKIARICQTCGKEFFVTPAKIKLGRGKFHSRECKYKWQSEHMRGENSPSWQGGLSFEPYCIKFNNEFKEKIREKFGRVCFLCPKTEEAEGRKLSVHHVNYNKGCGCDDDETCQFVPLCRSCNSKVNTNRNMWEKKIKDMMHNKLSGWVI